VLFRSTVSALAGISQPGVPGREFSRCTGLAAVAEVAGTVPDVLLRLDPTHALRISATIAALMARNFVYGLTSVAPVDPGGLSI
jgi:hypothetical protein